MKNQYKKVKHASQTEDLSNGHRLSLLDILRWALDGSKIVKKVEYSVPFNEDYVMYDLSTVSKGNAEDIAFAVNLKLRNNIRRGNSIIAKYSEARSLNIDQKRLVKHDGIDYEISEID